VTAPSEPSTVVLVEGVSDQRAVEALARRLGRSFPEERVAVVPMGGAQAIGAFLDRYGPHGLDVRLAGLVDVGEEAVFGRALERAGLGTGLERADMERLGFYVCVEDLEDELIRAAGVDIVEEVIAAEGELESFRTFQRQPAWRGRPLDEQLRRFVKTHSGRNIRTATLLADALDLARMPRPLGGLLAHV
jgi:Overcoming lysogenization defect protein-like, TOPRIM domain